MKNRIDQILLAAFFLTAALSAYFLLVWIEGIPRPFYDPDDPFRFYELWVYLGLGFHAVPCFCLQLLLCRAAKNPGVRLIPALLLLGLADLVHLGIFQRHRLGCPGLGPPAPAVCRPSGGLRAGLGGVRRTAAPPTYQPIERCFYEPIRYL